MQRKKEPLLPATRPIPVDPASQGNNDRIVTIIIVIGVAFTLIMALLMLRGIFMAVMHNGNLPMR